MADSPPQSGKQKPREELVGVEEEAKLLREFLELPSIGKAWCLPGAGGSATLTVRLQLCGGTGKACRIFLTLEILIVEILCAYSERAGTLDLNTAHAYMTHVIACCESFVWDRTLRQSM